MKKNLLVGSIIGIVLILIIIIVVIFFQSNVKSKNVKFDSNYKSYIEIKLDSDIILMISQKDTVSNILYLNEESVDTLANQKIEGKKINQAIELIVDKLKNNNEFDNTEEINLIKYKNDSTYTDIVTFLNKEFVIYGINNKLVENEGNLEEKVISINKEIKSSEKDNLHVLYEYSKELLKK